jgi:opacity protein-like surface antigen
MKKIALAVLSLALAVGAAQARDTVVHVKLSDVLDMPEAKEKLDPNFRFYLAGAQTPKVEKTLGEGVTNQKTNGVGKSDEFGCKWVVLSGLIRLQESAKQNGGNAVVNIVSYYKKNEWKDAEKIECHAGNIIIGAALKGQYAKID